MNITQIEVDEQGRCDSADGDYGPYGSRLSIGDMLTLYDYRTYACAGRYCVTHRYTRIQTRQHHSNFVYFDVAKCVTGDRS